jgi:hypothetical protein
VVPLVTDFEALVVRSIKGSDLKAGDIITVTAHGGQDAYGSARMENEPLPLIGQEEVVFLERNQLNVTKYTFINPQGRFSVTTAGRFQAVNQEDGVTKKYDDLRVDQLEATIQADVGA